MKPGDLTTWKVFNGVERHSGRPVKQENVAVHAHRRKRGNLFSVYIGIVQNERRADIGFPHIMACHLKMPAVLAGLEIHRDNRGRVQIISGADFAPLHGKSVACAEVDQT